MAAQILGFTALIASAVFSGACWYITFVENPARMHRGTLFAGQEFRSSLPRSRSIQRGIAIVAVLSSAAEYFLTRQTIWIAIASLMFLILPYTWLVLFKINSELLAEPDDRVTDSTETLLRKWAPRHFVRNLLSSGAAILACVAMSRTTAF